MVITLTPAQWIKLKEIVYAGNVTEKTLTLPIQIDNGNQSIEIAVDETKITLED